MEEESVAAATRAFLDRTPFLRELMAMDAVNYRGLARSLRPHVLERTGKDSVQLDAIVMAVRRYEQDTQADRGAMRRIDEVLDAAALTLQNNYSYVTLPRTPDHHAAALATFEAVDEPGGDRAYLLQSDSEIGLVLHSGQLPALTGRIDPDVVKHREEDLALVVMDGPEQTLAADGIIAFLTDHIHRRGISLVDMVTTYTEFVFLVRRADGARLYEVLDELTRTDSARPFQH